MVIHTSSGMLLNFGADVVPSTVEKAFGRNSVSDFQWLLSLSDRLWCPYRRFLRRSSSRTRWTLLWLPLTRYEFGFQGLRNNRIAHGGNSTLSTEVPSSWCPNLYSLSLDNISGRKNSSVFYIHEVFHNLKYDTSKQLSYCIYLYTLHTLTSEVSRWQFFQDSAIEENNRFG
ncbi:hypothetical protein AGLY_008639 [Aphis glycines]|uniref:Uncharacterized protein n=1 Tax=Aphis glycines TaxID=307491 RepID=A0A6G0TMU5_APHGL|nr:hypothetical protein AGLY_008639 [Aphis glycines]